MNTDAENYIGIDVGTSGVRAVCINSNESISHSAHTTFREHGCRNDPAVWLLAVSRVITDLLVNVEAVTIKAIAVDGTSGTMIVTDSAGSPLSKAKMYNDSCDDQSILNQISAAAPDTSAAHGASSGLAKAIELSRIKGAACIQHEADWIAAALSGKINLSDENNSLKTGYDPVSRRWPEWINRTDMPVAMLPTVLSAGQSIGPAIGHLAMSLGLSPKTTVIAGTTDGCASFMATGAKEAGEGVTALGSTLTIKLLSTKPIFEPAYGIYSHRIGNTWLAGGASNTGGAVLAHYFNDEQLRELSAQIDSSVKTELDYYPLVKSGERFPFNDSTLTPRVSPRPLSDTEFLKGLLQGIANIEQLAYQRLSELGGPELVSVRTVGGGAKNPSWLQLRKNTIDTLFLESLSGEAAMGTALLAKRAMATAALKS